MKESGVAARYAKSLIELGEEMGKLELLANDMELFVSVCNQNKDFLNMLSSPLISQTKKITILSKIFESKIDVLAFKFLELVTKKHRESMLFEIGKKFKKLYHLNLGIQEASVVTVKDFSSSQRAEIIDAVKTFSGMKNVDLKERLDKNLIGGFILKIDDKQFDNSVKSKLLDLKQNLIQK